MTPIDHWRTLDKHGNELPWYTRPCLKWLISLPVEGMNVFEFGCGVSSVWYIKNTKFSAGVDNIREWLPDHHHYHFRTNKQEYMSIISGITNTNWFDLIIIDGGWRDDCTKYALPKLKKGGYLIADNFEQPSADLAHWPKTRELTKHLPLTIYKEEGHIDWVTAVWRNA